LWGNTPFRVPSIDETKSEARLKGLPSTLPLAKMPNYEATKNNKPPVDTKGDGLTAGKVGSFLANMSPIMYNLAMGLGKPDKVTPKYNPYESQALALMHNRRFDINPLLEQNSIAQAIANRNLKESGATGGRLGGGLAAYQNARMRGDAAAWSEKHNQDLGYMGQEAEMMNNFGQQRAGMDWETETAQAQNLASKRNFLGQAFGQASQLAQMYERNKMLKFRDAQLAGLYPDMYSQIYQYQPWMQQIVAAAKAGKGGF
jgi:hypothetical protein